MRNNISKKDFSELLNPICSGLFVFIFCVSFTELTPLKFLDTEDYIIISEKWFEAENFDRRSIGYPILIWFHKAIFDGDWGYAMIYFQIILYVLSSVIFWYMIKKTFQNINVYVVSIIVLFCFLNPQSLAFTLALLPESAPLFFALLSLLLFEKIPSCNDKKKYKYIYISFFSAFSAFFAYLLKPIWLLLVFSIYLFILIKFVIKKTFMISNSFYFGVFFGIFYIGMQFYFSLNGHNSLPSVKDINLNLSILRLGKIKGTENTQMYKYLDANGLIQQISERSWTDQPSEYKEFSNFKNIPKKYLINSEFWASSLTNKNNFKAFFIKTCERIPKFFTTSAENGAITIFRGSYINYLYQAGYSFFHKKFIFFLIISYLLLAFILRYRIQDILKRESSIIILGVLVFSFSIGIVSFTYQDQLFLRMRAGINPLVIFIFIYPLICLIDNFFGKEKIKVLLSELIEGSKVRNSN